ncbi:MAG: Lrp/AsnC ligand binding domain-containing protein [Methanobacteriota archaeon]
MRMALVAFKKRAYLLIGVDPGYEASLIRQLEKMEYITNVDFVHGEYDVVCVLEGKHQDMDKTIVEVRKLPHIRKTTTLTAFDTHLE